MRFGKTKQWMALLGAVCLCAATVGGCRERGESGTEAVGETQGAEETGEGAETAGRDYDRDYIERTLNLANNEAQEWTYDDDANAWILSVVPAVAYPQIADEQGVSVCVPGAYVKGVDTDGDGTEDVTADTASDAAQGALVINYESKVTSENGGVYTASTAPIILNTGAAGYGSSTNTTAAVTYAADGYINVSCGNRGKQDQLETADGTVVFTGDAPCCLVDQKNAARFIRYNILLGNLPGDERRFISTGGSGGGAHAVMLAATSNHPDFYDYEIDAGAVGVYPDDNGGYSTTVTIDGTEREISDGVWGCIAYSAITSLYEADMAMAFEYYLDTDYEFGSPFQAKLAELLASEYMEYINAQELSVNEMEVGFDLNGDGDTEDEIALSIEYDADKYSETNGYGGSYLELYLAEFVSDLQWYVDYLDYSAGWTWFDADGNALPEEAFAELSTEEKAQAFIEGRYTKGSSGAGTDDVPGGGDDGFAGTPEQGTTQAAGSSTDTANYGSYEEMLTAYRADIEEIAAGDLHGKNLAELYDPLRYIGEKETEAPAWIRIVMGASEGDMSMFSSLNLQLAFLKENVHAVIEWQWDGGHVPSEVLGNSFSLYVDQMFVHHAGSLETITRPDTEWQTENGDADAPEGADLSDWVTLDKDGMVSFTLADAVSYRTKGASKAVPGFDVIDYGQEDYVFGSAEKDARHWNPFLRKVLEEHEEELSPLLRTR